MAKMLQPVVPQVALAWATRFWPEERHPEAASREVQAASQRVQSAGAARFSTGTPPREPPVLAQQHELAPELVRRGMPHSPPPSVPERDRLHRDEQATLSAAVALDVLATWTQQLGNTPQVLVRLTETLLQLAAVGGDTDPVRALLAYAETEEATGRAQLARALIRSLAGAFGADADAPLPACSPLAVAQALRRIERLAAVVVAEARLAFEARETTTFRQA